MPLSVVNGNNIGCSSLTSPPWKHTQQAGGGDSELFSPLFLGNMGRWWELQQSLLTPGFHTSAGCSLPFIIAISLSQPPALRADLQPSRQLCLPPISPQLCSCCQGPNLFFSLQMSLVRPFVCGSAQSTHCGCHQWSTAGSSLKCCDVWGSLIWSVMQKVVVVLLALLWQHKHRQSF